MGIFDILLQIHVDSNCSGALRTLLSSKNPQRAWCSTYLCCRAVTDRPRGCLSTKYIQQDQVAHLEILRNSERIGTPEIDRIRSAQNTKAPFRTQTTTSSFACWKSSEICFPSSRVRAANCASDTRTSDTNGCACSMKAKCAVSQGKIDSVQRALSGDATRHGNSDLLRVSLQASENLIGSRKCRLPVHGLSRIIKPSRGISMRNSLFVVVKPLY